MKLITNFCFIFKLHNLFYCIFFKVMNLSANQCQDLSIWFNPTFEQGRHSRCITKKVQIAFRDHPRKVDLFFIAA